MLDESDRNQALEDARTLETKIAQLDDLILNDLILVKNFEQTERAARESRQKIVDRLEERRKLRAEILDSVMRLYERK